MLLSELIAHVPGAVITGAGDVVVTGIAYDSRAVQAGQVFVAVSGYKDDGLCYAVDAIERGAVAIIADRECRFPVPTVMVADARRALSAVAAQLYGYPSRELRVIGVTGTNGKTTTTYLIRSILQAAGRPVGVIGTIGVAIADKVVPGQHTTPEAPDIHQLLRDMVGRGITDVVMEVSSHALFLHRTADIEFMIGVFTNLTPEHLDFHENLDHYRQTKTVLFSGLEGADRRAVINVDDPSAGVMMESSRVPVVRFGFDQADVVGSIRTLSAEATDMVMRLVDEDVHIRLPLLGRFNASNALAAAAAAVAMNISAEHIRAGLEQAAGVPGRFERVPADPDLPTVIVDYAHTPDGLKQVLIAARECSAGRVIVVFGCGGDRDRTKRPVMGAIACELADQSIITSDNPRTEDPGLIAEQIEQGAIKAGGQYRVILDRKQAINAAISIAEPTDVVVIAGKGHETYQLIGEQTLPFDDREQARQALDLRRQKGG